MALRPSWKGYLKLSLVSCAVALYPATTTSSRIRFNIINRQTGNRINNQVVDAETGEPVEEDDRVKGYEIEKGRYVLVEDKDFEDVALESTHTIDIESFVPREEVDEIYLDNSYYLVPTDEVGVEAFSVIREAMKKQNVAGLARVVLYRRERILMLQHRGNGLVASALRYRNEVRDEKLVFDDVPKEKIAGDMLDLAIHIVKTKEGHFQPDKFEDRYETALADLIKAKDKGKPLPKPDAPRRDNVINLMDALRRSVKAEKADAPVKEKAGASKSSATPRRAAKSKSSKAAGKRAAPKRMKRAG